MTIPAFSRTISMHMRPNTNLRNAGIQNRRFSRFGSVSNIVNILLNSLVNANT